MANERAGELLGQLLRQSHLTDAEAARRSGVSINTLKNYKAGTTTPAAVKLMKVAALFSPADAARLVDAYGFPGLMGDQPATLTEADAIAAIIAETEAALTKLKAVYSKIMENDA